MLLDGIARRRGARGDVQLAVDGAQVGIDGARAQDELSGHLGIGQSSCHQPQHLNLAGGQTGGIGCGWLHRFCMLSRSVQACQFFETENNALPVVQLPEKRQAFLVIAPRRRNISLRCGNACQQDELIANKEPVPKFSGKCEAFIDQ